MRSYTYRKQLANNQTQSRFCRQMVPNKLRTRCRMVDLAFQRSGIHPFVFIRVYQTFGRFEVALECQTVLAEIMKQANQLARAPEPDFRGMNPG